MSSAATPTAAETPHAPLDDRDVEPRTPMKRLGSTRKLAAFNNIRLQLAEQTRVLEARAEATAGVAGELHEYCRRRADLEHEYSRALDKLARAASQRHKDQRHKRAEWPLVGAFACWQAALDTTRALARDHAALADLYGGPLAVRLQRAADDALRLHRKCRDVLLERHEEVAAALADAAAAGKAHAAAHADWRHAALKLRHAHDQRADPPRHKKLKALDKELDKRRERHAAARGKALRARAEYALSLEAANATLQRYYLDDVADIILCMEVGFEAVVGRTCRAAAAAEGARGAAAGGAAAALRLAADALDALADRQRLLGAHAATFALPRPLAPPPPDAEPPPPGAEPDAGAAAAAVRADLDRRLLQLEAAARTLRAECQENAKTLDAAEAELVRRLEGDDADWDVSGLFGAGAAPAALPPPAPTDDQEDYYLAKFRAYAGSAGRLARVEGKAAWLRGAPPASPPRRAARPARGLFSAPLDAEARLPRVLTECVRVIATYGLRHQGVFRVSGSVVEMAALRAAFERGEEPLAEARDASDLNSVCGLLKLFLREVRPPLLPPQLQERLLRIAALPDDAAFVARLRATLAALPLPAVLVLRYLFAFLAHLAENSHHNMMDAWNLAICVGPTLLAAWGEGPHQLAAQNLVNELVKRTILHHEEVFPQDVAPEALYRRPGEPPAATPAPPAPGDAPAAPGGEDLHEEEGAPPDLDDDTDEETSSEGEGDVWRRRSGSAGESAPPRARPAPEQALPESAPHSAAADSAAPLSAPQSAAPQSAAPQSAAPQSAAVTPSCRRLPESTPDLVLDLPEPADGPAPAPTPPAAAPADAAPAPAPAPAPDHTAADAFAHNRDTMRKRPPAPPRSESPGARHTARVAAQFAELTLTGGSKPALAAKPALLRRPTPHPRPTTPAAPAAPSSDAAPSPPPL